MSRETHYDRIQRQNAPYIQNAKERVEARGWKAWQDNLGQGRRDLEVATLGAVIVRLCLEKVFNSLGDTAQDYRNFYEHPEVHGFYQMLGQAMRSSGMTTDVVSSELSTMIAQQWHQFLHAKHGNRVYEISDGLAERLRHTELRGLKTNDLKLPYPAIYIDVPASAGHKVWNYKTDWHPVEGVYVAESTDDEYGRVWRFMVIGTSKNPKDEFDDALFYFTVPLPDGVSINEALEKEHRRVLDKYMDRDVIREYADEWLVLFQWVMNVVIYATYSDARAEEHIGNPEARRLYERLPKHPKGSAKRQKILDELRNINPLRRTLLGKGVPLWKPEERGLGPTGRKYELRILVQGHWKQQAYGPQRSLRKTLWIEPYWRGPELGEDNTPRHVL